MAWTLFGTNLNPVTPIPRHDAPLWAAATFYRYGDLIYYNLKYYLCLDGHTSAIFANELGAGKWEERAEVKSSIYMDIGLNPIPLDNVRVRKNGVTQSRFSSYNFYTIRHDFANARTTGLIAFLQPLVLLDVLSMDYDSSYAEYFQSLPNLDSRLQTVEAKLAGISDVNAAVSGLDVRIDALEAQDTVHTNLIAGNTTEINLLKGRMDVVENRVTATEVRLASLESFSGLQGVVTILNEQLVPLEIPEFMTLGEDISSVRLDYEIQRFTGTEYRSSVGTLHLCLQENGVWMTDRGLISFDMDGITFTISTSLPKVGKVFYTTDLVAGASYVGTMKFRRYAFEV